MAVVGRRRGERGCSGSVVVRATAALACVGALLATVAGCSASSNPVEGTGGDAAACAAAGGFCVTRGGVGLCPNAGPKVCGAGADCCVLVGAIMPDASADSGTCDRAGGRCVLGGNTCTKPLAGDESCDSENNPGGAFYCIDK
jgi:hypothetical protein